MQISDNKHFWLDLPQRPFMLVSYKLLHRKVCYILKIYIINSILEWFKTNRAQSLYDCEWTIQKSATDISDLN